MVDISALFETAYRDMDPVTGMFPADWTCQHCGRVLNADNNHPAEIYAGSYNGLCYPCTSTNPYVVKVYTYDGAREVSWPPSKPSYRRNRETFFGYTDCKICLGMGATQGYPHGPFHARLWDRCPECSKRFHGARRPYWDALDALYHWTQWAFQQWIAARDGWKPRGPFTERTLGKRSQTAWESIPESSRKGVIAESGIPDTYVRLKTEIELQYAYLYKTTKGENHA